MDTVGRDRLFKAKQHNLPIRVHLQKMYSKYLREVVQYPKIYKPTIGQDMRECFAALRTKINHAAKLQHKLTALREADTALECLRAVVVSFLGYMQHCKGKRSADSALKRMLLRRR